MKLLANDIPPFLNLFAMNAAAQPLQPSISLGIEKNNNLYSFTEPHKDAPRKASISLKLDIKKEVLKIRSTLPINEVSINDLFGKKLIQIRNRNEVKLSSLARGVYELEVKLEGTTLRKRIILQ